MDYFYLSEMGMSKKKGAQAMSTKELQKRLRDMGKSDRGTRPVLVERYERATAAEGPEYAIAFNPASAATGLAVGGPGVRPTRRTTP